MIGLQIKLFASVHGLVISSLHLYLHLLNFQDRSWYFQAFDDSDFSSDIDTENELCWLCTEYSNCTKDFPHINSIISSKVMN